MIFYPQRFPEVFIQKSIPERIYRRWKGSALPKRTITTITIITTTIITTTTIVTTAITIIIATICINIRTLTARGWCRPMSWQRNDKLWKSEEGDCSADPRVPHWPENSFWKFTKFETNLENTRKNFELFKSNQTFLIEDIVNCWYLVLCVYCRLYSHSVEFVIVCSWINMNSR